MKMNPESIITISYEYKGVKFETKTTHISSAIDLALSEVEKKCPETVVRIQGFENPSDLLYSNVMNLIARNTLDFNIHDNPYRDDVMYVKRGWYPFSPSPRRLLCIERDGNCNALTVKELELYARFFPKLEELYIPDIAQSVQVVVDNVHLFNRLKSIDVLSSYSEIAHLKEMVKDNPKIIVYMNGEPQ